MRKKTKKILLGGIVIGGGAPITIQSMTNTKTENIESTIQQIYQLTVSGCEIIRVSAPTMEAAKALKEIKKEITIPLIADIHFDYRIALESIKSGIDGLRLNPGNIGNIKKIKEVVNAAKDNNIPIRIGVNGGSLERDILKKYGSSTPEALVESAMRHVKILENLDFYNTKISLKSSDIIKTVESYRLISQRVDYPLHIGITEAGTLYNGTIKSSIGLGILLYDGIGDTLRVSLTADPVEEVKAGIAILKHLGIRKEGVTFVSCPSCARADSDFIEIANDIEKLTSSLDKDIRIAVMGCIVNGPGEAKEADWAIVSAGRDKASIYKAGKFLESIQKDKLIARFSDLLTK